MPTSRSATWMAAILRGEEVRARAAPDVRESVASIVRPSGRIARKAPFMVNRDSSIEIANAVRVIIEAKSSIV